MISSILLRSFVCIRSSGQPLSGQPLIMLLAAAVWLGLQASPTLALDLQSVNEAEFSQGRAQAAKGPDPILVKAQVLLDRARFSPGEIDGRMGENLLKAIKAFAAALLQPLDCNKLAFRRCLHSAISTDASCLSLILYATSRVARGGH
jgi:hypothetical protein